jgi:single-strand DNA-binding protein
MTDTISITGLVATAPKHVVTGTGLSITSFRFASTQRRYDRAEQKWVDGDTNWYTVTAFRQLAINVVASIQKGQRVIVSGRLRVRDWSTDDKHGTNVEIDADAVGHDLSWGTTAFTRSTATAVADAERSADDPAEADDPDADADADEDADDEADGSEPRRQEPASAGLPF